MSVIDKDLDITVVGSIFMDLICYAERLPKPGETFAGTDFKAGYGGKGANQCVAAQRVGAKTAFVGKVGRDAYGKEYYDNLVKEGVNVEGIKFEDDVPTGVASILVGNDTGENMIVIVEGATKLVTPAYVNQVAERLIERSKTVVCQLEIPLESTLAALRIAAKKGATTIFNAAPGRELPREIFGLVDILCVNVVELEQVAKAQVVKSIDDAKEAVEILRSDNTCRHIIVTLGSEGALLWDNDSQTYEHFPAPKVTAVDTTGAGDSFVGTLAHCVARGDDLQSAVRQSILNSADSVKRKGTQSSFPFGMISS